MAQYEGELAWPERFDTTWDTAMAFELGDNAYAGQYQQSPVPRKGGIIKREYWQDYIPSKGGKFPDNSSGISGTSSSHPSASSSKDGHWRRYACTWKRSRLATSTAC
jgi:hypothetical protein